MTGRIFEIREFTLHDGPGIRTTVFLKGCPLHCAWCHNPEGQKFEKETMRRRDGTLVPCGIDWDADALAEDLLINADIMQQSGGGVTFSGGEPLAQAEFVRAVAGKLKAHGIHLAVETSGCVAPECYRAVASCMDFVYQDLKLGNSEDFRRWCGGSLETVLENIAWLRTSGIKFVFRTPLIPGVNDTPESKAAIAAIAAGAPHEWLPFNPAASAKYPMLGRDWCLKETYPPFFFRK